MYAFALAAAAIALYFLVTTLRRPRPAAVLALVLWAAYAVYEYLTANGTLCDANCNIRVDLLIFLPLLGIATALALRERTSTGAVVVLAVICLVLLATIAAMLGNVTVAALAGVGALAVGLLGVRSIARSNQA